MSHPQSRNGWLLPYLRRHWRLFSPLLAGAGVMYLFTNALAAWAPSLFVRRFHWEASEVGIRLGVLITPCAIAGSVLSGVVATLLSHRFGSSAPLRTMLLGSGILAPVALLGPLAPVPGLALACVVAMYFAFSLCFGVATATFVAATPPPLRGQMVALYLLIGNLIGLGFGPVLVGTLLDHLPRGGESVGDALAITAAVSVVPGFLLLGVSLRPYVERANAITIAEGSTAPGVWNTKSDRKE